MVVLYARIAYKIFIEKKENASKLNTSSFKSHQNL